MKLFKMDKNHLWILLISLVIFVIITFVYQYTIFVERLENNSIDFRFFMSSPEKNVRKLRDIKGSASIQKPNPRARKDIVIVGIDEDTLNTFIQDENIRWPFPWDIHNRVTRYIAADKPNAIFFDIMFLEIPRLKGVSTPGRLNNINLKSLDRLRYSDMRSVYSPIYNQWWSAQEKEFARTIRKAGCVFLDYPFFTEETSGEIPNYEQRMEVLNSFTFPMPANEIPQKDCSKEYDSRCPWVKNVTPPTLLLTRAAKGVGYANVRADADKINRKVPLLIRYKYKDKYQYYPSIDLLLAMNYYGIEKKDIEIKMGEYIKLKNLPADKMKIPNERREIKIPIDNDGFMDINFIGGPYSFRNFSYYFFNREPDAQGNFKDKIVFIAAYGVTGIATDIHKSPFGETFGVEHHANAVNTILNQDFITKLSDNQNILIFLIIAILFGIILARASIVKSVVFTVVFTIGYAIVAVVLFHSNNLIFAFATPIIQVGTVFTLVTVFKVLTEQKEKKMIRQTFSKFVSKSVVDELLEDPENVKLGGEKMILTVLFSDIRGFTSISEGMPPEDLVLHLNDYLQDMTEIVFKYNGTLDKYVGDEIMAFWGAPLPQEDHAMMACKAAIEMMSVLGELNKEWASVGKPEMNIGIGLNTGEMVVGNMGSASRMDYTLMGDNVNLGARLEGTNKEYKTNIIISEYTYEYVKDQIIARELGLVKVKGKEIPVKIYELIDII